MKGILALDIDGTITTEKHEVSPRVRAAFEKLAKEGWHFIFITGRTFQWGFEVLKQFSFPYHFAVQNGALILEMPSRRILFKKYLDKSIFPRMEKIVENEPSDFVVYGGFEYGDFCYYRKSRFDKDLLKYLTERVDIFKESWKVINSYSEIPHENFASIKCFGFYDSACRIAEKLEKDLQLHAPVISDPFQSDYYIVQAIHSELNKGFALNMCKKLLDWRGVVIAAGDDNNDIPMLKEADIKIVMATAPQEILALADIVAPSAKEEGILKALQEAMK